MTLVADLTQRLFDTSADLILIVSPYGELIKVSPSALDILGYPPEEMEGHIATDFLYPPDLESTKREMRRARSGDVVRNFECRYVDKGGDPVRIRWNGSWEEKERHYFFVGRDVSGPDIERYLSQVDLSHVVLGLMEKALYQVSIMKSEEKSRLWKGEGFSAELAVIAWSGWGMWVLLTGPSNFEEYPVVFGIIERLHLSETQWASFLTVGVVGSVFGIIGSWIKGDRRRFGCFAPRAIGLGLSAWFWLVMGAGTVAGNPDTLFGFGGIIMACLAIRALFLMV